MNLKMVLTILVVSLLLVSLGVGFQAVKADSADSIVFSGGVTLLSPVNTTYESNFLTLNVSFEWGEGLQCSLNYTIDGNYGGPVPLTLENPELGLIIATASGTVQLPELSNGSHCLTIIEEANLNNYYSANPPGAPFKPAGPGSADYYAAWVDTVDFSINTSYAATNPTASPAPTDSPAATPTPSTPEFPLVVLPILLVMVSLAIVTMLRKRAKTKA